jgi:hypothetical protein
MIQIFLFILLRSLQWRMISENISFWTLPILGQGICMTGYAWTQLATIRSVLPFLGMVAADNRTLGGTRIQIGESFQVGLGRLRTRFQIGKAIIRSDWIARREQSRMHKINDHWSAIVVLILRAWLKASSETISSVAFEADERSWKCCIFQVDWKREERFELRIQSLALAKSRPKKQITWIHHVLRGEKGIRRTRSKVWRL